MQAALEEEKAVRESLITKTQATNKSLQNALEQARRDLIEAQEDAASNKRESMLANFAHNSVEKSLQAVRHELAAAREQLSRMQMHAKEVVDREREHVQRLQRELASTKEMLRVSQKAQGSGRRSGSKYGMGGRDVIMAAREQIFVSNTLPTKLFVWYAVD